MVHWCRAFEGIEKPPMDLNYCLCVLHEWLVVSNHSQSSLLDFNYSFSFS